MRRALLIAAGVAGGTQAFAASGPGGARRSNVRNHLLDLAGRRAPRPSHPLRPERSRWPGSRPRTSSSTRPRGSSATRRSSPAAPGPRLRPAAVPVRCPGRADHHPRQLRRRPQPPARHRPDLRRRSQAARKPPASPSTCRRSNIPVAIPVTVRSASDYGLRFTVSNITQTVPLSEADLTFWGFPADEVHDDERFPKGSPGTTRRAARNSPTPAASPHADPRQPSGSAADRQPLGLRGADGDHARRSRPTSDPATFMHAESSYPQITDCESQTFKPVAQARPDHRVKPTRPRAWTSNSRSPSRRARRPRPRSCARRH